MIYANYHIGKTWKCPLSGARLTHLSLRHIGQTPQGAARFHADYHADLEIEDETRLYIVCSNDPPPYLILLDENCFVGMPEVKVSFEGPWVNRRILDATGIGMRVHRNPESKVIMREDLDYLSEAE